MKHKWLWALVVLFLLGIYWGLSAFGRVLQLAGAAGVTALAALSGFAALPSIIAALMWGWLFGLFGGLFDWFPQSQNPPGGATAPSMNLPSTDTGAVDITPAN